MGDAASQVYKRLGNLLLIFLMVRSWVGLDANQVGPCPVLHSMYVIQVVVVVI